jgi:hypothetical protein
MSMNADTRFFYTHAAPSYNPAKETQEQGRVRNAENLAAAEGIARNAGVSFAWTCTDRRAKASKWMCMAYDASGNYCASKHEIEFDAKGPHGNAYRRVIEAELADEYVTDELNRVISQKGPLL